MTVGADPLGDLLDGGSTLTGIVGGLDDYVQFGGFDVQQLLGRTADWRRAVPKSVYPDLIEALIFENWAWGARGFGGANEVRRSSIAKVFTGGMKLIAVLNAELGSRAIGAASSHGTIMTRMSGIIIDCASRMSLTAEPTAAIADPMVR